MPPAVQWPLCAYAPLQQPNTNFPVHSQNDGIDVGHGRGDGAQSSPTGRCVGAVEAGVLPEDTDLDHAITMYNKNMSKMMPMSILKLKYRYLKLMSKMTWMC